MKPKEKAEEIYFAMLNAGKGFTSDFTAQQCAITSVNQIVESIKTSTDHLTLKRNDILELENDFSYWAQVKDYLRKSILS